MSKDSRGILLIENLSLYRKQFSTLVSNNDDNLDLAIESWSIEEDTLNLED